ncbi:MAG: ATP phosphoribosyltransferase regulatory subunit [Bilifractor sp.]|jgi:ATP phosphoribosyltransferase regulatory subunit
MKKLIHTPEGVRDIFGRECDRKRYLERQIEKLYRSYGYQSIETPGFEFFDVFAKEVGTTPSRDLYKFFDRDGNTLVLRSDFTPSVARAVAMYFGEEEMPLRLCYHGSIYRNNHSYHGSLNESTQMGVEFMNDDSAEADAEIIALVVSTMRRAGLENFQVSMGHVDYFNALAEEAGMSEESLQELRNLLAAQNRFGAEELIDQLNIRPDLKKALVEMPGLFGNEEVLEQARNLTGNRSCRAAVDRLEQIYRFLKMYGCENYVTFDFGLVTEYRYYTGIIFQAYTYGSGDALIKGGRYNRLIEHFGKKCAAVGFATEIDSLLNAIERQKISLPVEDIKTMILYPAEMEEMAIHYANSRRANGLEVACVRFEYGKVVDDYRRYGMRNQFGGIIYFRSMDEVYAINLSNGSTERIYPFGGNRGNGGGTQ